MNATLQEEIASRRVSVVDIKIIFAYFHCTFTESIKHF